MVLGQIGNWKTRCVYIEKAMIVSDEYDDLSKLLIDVMAIDGKLKNRSTLRKIFYLGANSPGCDSLCFHETEEGDLVVRALSAKFSKLDHTKQISEIRDGYDKIHQAFNKYPQLKSRIYFIVHSW